MEFYGANVADIEQITLDYLTRTKRSVVIVGLMGAGKSCVGRRIAECLSLPFVDADREIEEAAGCSIADIFELYGEGEFRDGERRVIRRLLENGPCVLATGGGAFMHEETREAVKELGVSLWLHAELEVLIKRTSGRKHRPLLNRGNPEQVLAKLIEKRYPVYSEADVTVNSLDEPLSETVNRVLKGLSAYIKTKSNE